jgi:hypothetical protein
MVTSIARQSVIIKCNMQKSVMLGNYEFYYAAGLLKKLFGMTLTAAMPPEELSEAILGQTADAHPKDEKEQYLLQIAGKYEPLAQYDDQMKELFAWGAQEPDLWNIKTTYQPQQG